jgi:hypothetical protein
MIYWWPMVVLSPSLACARAGASVRGVFFLHSKDLQTGLSPNLVFVDCTPFFLPEGDFHLPHKVLSTIPKNHFSRMSLFIHVFFYHCCIYVRDIKIFTWRPLSEELPWYLLNRLDFFIGLQLCTLLGGGKKGGAKKLRKTRSGHLYSHTHQKKVHWRWTPVSYFVFRWAVVLNPKLLD